MAKIYLCPNCGERTQAQVRQSGLEYFCTHCGEAVDELSTRTLRIPLSTPKERDLVAQALAGRQRPPGLSPNRWILLSTGKARALSRTELSAFVAAYGQGWLALIGMGPGEG